MGIAGCTRNETICFTDTLIKKIKNKTNKCYPSIFNKVLFIYIFIALERLACECPSKHSNGFMLSYNLLLTTIITSA